jgi:predicted acetyltransferase
MTARTIRSVARSELVDYHRAVALQFGEHLDDEGLEVMAASSEPDRSFACFEGDRIVGTAEHISFTMGLPDAPPAPCAGLTSVGVNPARRRRGILSDLMRRLLDDAHERGEPFAALYASEARIYGRYGYGPAAPAMNVMITAPHGRLRDPVPDTERIELIDADEALGVLPGIYDRVQAASPGMMDRSPGRWQFRYGNDLESWRDGCSPRYHAVLDDRGYVVYRLKEGSRDGVPDGTVRVVEHVAADPEASAALWSFCLTQDLMPHVDATQRPPDDPLPLSLDDPARARCTPGEPLYVRLVDLPAALTARGYATAGSIVLEVADASCPWNAGRWRLQVAPDGASCERTTEEAELSLDTAELATAYLGQVRATTLLGARRLVEHRPGAARRLDVLLAAPRAPWNPRIF